MTKAEFGEQLVFQQRTMREAANSAMLEERISKNLESLVDDLLKRRSENQEDFMGFGQFERRRVFVYAYEINDEEDPTQNSKTLMIWPVGERRMGSVIYFYKKGNTLDSQVEYYKHLDLTGRTVPDSESYISDKDYCDNFDGHIDDLLSGELSMKQINGKGLIRALGEPGDSDQFEEFPDYGVNVNLYE